MQNLMHRVSALRERSDFSILFAEDEPMIQKPMATIMQKVCDDVVITSDGLEAWQCYQEREFSIVITDLQMPHMDGAQLIQHIKSVNPSQLIAVVTAYRDGEEIEKAKELGVDYVVLKPLSLAMFFEMMESVLDQIA